MSSPCMRVHKCDVIERLLSVTSLSVCKMSECEMMEKASQSER
jgi:hypothetical protein